MMIEHRSIVNLVESDVREFGLTPCDRVGQGSSAAYDSSIEETWLAFAVGATLVVMDDHTSRMGPDLVPWLKNERISVFCPPPTLLRTTGCPDPSAALPELRLLYVGGEALTADLAAQWGRGRRLVNGYGPTECTVTVVRGDVAPGGAVTIGRPVPGHTAWVADEQLRAVSDGEQGELCIGGIGLARGYRGRPDVTREKFPDHPEFGRIYRTGDLVRREPSGELVYLGRIDAQVKLRGYRIELEAVEACLAQCPGVREAACRVQGEGPDALLTAHVVAADPRQPPDVAAARAWLRRTLPPYMVPARLGLVDALPRSVGGKVDRKRLPTLGPGDGGEPSGREVVAPGNEREAAIVVAFAAALRTASAVSVHDDFFVDLGGDSLSAVAVICRLREDPATASITTRDLYVARTAAQLAHCAAPAAEGVAQRAVAPAPTEGGVARPFWVTIGQGVWVLVGVLAVSVAAYTITFDLLPLMLDRFGLAWTLVLELPLALAGLVAYTALTVMVTVVLKLALIGEYRPIRTPVWSSLFLRHWIVQSAARAIPWNLLAGTAMYGVVLRLLGAKVGRRVHVHRGVNLQQGGWDLLTLGDDVTLSSDARLGLVELEGGCLCIGPVEVQDGATIDIRATVSGHAVVESRGFVAALSWLPPGARVPAGERWDGVPAVRAGSAPEAPTPESGSAGSPTVYTIAHLLLTSVPRAGAAALLLGVFGVMGLVVGLDGERVAAWLAEPSWSVQWLAVVILVSVAAVPGWLVATALSARWAGVVRPGTIHRWSFSYLRIWHKAAAVESAGLWLTGTMFWPIWLRLAGMNIGRGCEISTITDVVPESLRIGEESFFADGIYLGGPRVHRGTVTVGQTSLGRGTFLGNHVVIPAGAELPDDFFVGVSTVADGGGGRFAPGTSWFGHPPMELPRRDVVSVDRRLTHSPGALRFCTRLFWEALRFAIPVLPIILGALWIWGATVVDASWPVTVLLLVPASTLAVAAVSCAAVIALKWLLLGRARAGQHPLWSCWCSRWDFLYVAWQFYATPVLATLEGTLWLNAYLRAMGVRIGRRVVLGPGLGHVADPDMIVIEDGATVNANYQAHSFEDRVLKLAPVFVRKGATVGESAVLFYGAEVGAGATVSPNSVVMKHERLQPGRAYSGCPVQAQSAQAHTDVPTGETDLAALAHAALKGRYAFLDIARGLAVAGMIYMHFVPSERGDGSAVLPWTAAAAFLEGKSAAMFCVLAGVAWELQARRAARDGRSRWYLVRRAAALAVAGVAFHALAWPTEILVPFAVMMVIAMGLRRLGERAVLAVAVLLVALAPAVPALLGEYVSADWNDDGSHATDGAIGWATLRALTFDGSYPLLPWLAFPLVGMLLAHRWKELRTTKRWFGTAVAVFVVSQLLVSLAGVHADDLGGAADLLVSNWEELATAPFVLVSGGFAVAAIAGLAWWQGTRSLGRVALEIGLFGRASLTHYILHVCLVYVPLRAVVGSEEWSVSTGMLAFAGYVALAVPLTVLWFRRFKRGPIEALWAAASGGSRPDSAKPNQTAWD
ncbi:MAG: AMP-binding protein [Phycisphaerales bacterium]|nr:AMP-binding protein [Phycisphaerales bacterium]